MWKEIFIIRNKKGVTLVLMAIMLALLVMFASLAIDIAYMYYAKNQLQVAADSAALAGAAKLLGDIDNITFYPNALREEAARQEAWKFACKNIAAGTRVYLITNTPANCDATPPTYSELNGDNNTNGEDIVVGHWDRSTGFTRATGSTGLKINAIQARPRRSDDSKTYGMPQVGLFFGKIFNIIGTDWSLMSVQASAIAARKPLASPGITFCIRACDLVLPKTMLIHEGSGPTCSSPTCLDQNDRMAFTAFHIAQAPNVGAGGDVVDLIWGRISPPDNICDVCITTNNTGGGGAALGELNQAFNDANYMHADKTFDSAGNVTNWRVAVPLVDRKCAETSNPCDACPPGCQGNKEPYHIPRIAVIDITAVIDTGAAGGRGVRINSINCIFCPTSWPLGNEFALVQ